MPFKKGHSGFKPPGTVHKKTKEWNELGDYIANEGAKRYLQIIMKLSDSEYQDRFEKILEYFKPKLQRSEVNQVTTLDLSSLTVDELKQLNTIADKLEFNPN